jgi:gliding motility-associated-like protein
VSSVTNSSFSWTNSNSSIGLPSNGSGNIPSFVGTNNGSNTIAGTIQVTPTYTNNSITCSGVNQQFTFSVNPVPDVLPVTDQTVCANSPVVVDLGSSTSVVNTVYNWINSNTSIGAASTGTGDISFTAANSSNNAQTGIFTVIPSFTNSGLTCNGSSTQFTISVNPVPVMSPIQSQVICLGDNSLPVNFMSSAGNSLYNWTNSNSSIGIVSSGQGNIPSFVGTNNTSGAITGNFSVIPSYTNNNKTCIGTPQLFSISVNPVPVINNLPDITLCANEANGQVVFTSNALGATYNWTNNNINIGIGSSGSGNLPPFTATNNSSSIITATINVIATSTFNNSTCTSNPEVFTISVNPRPSVNDVANSIYCAGTLSQNFLFTGPVTGTTYTWYNSNSSIGLPSNGTGNISPFVVSNNQSLPATGTITILPSTSLNGGTCTGDPATFTITINPKPNVNEPEDQILCGGTTSNNVIFNGNVSNTVYTWTNNNTLTGLTTNGQGNINSFTTPNNLANPETSSIIVTPNYTNIITCSGLPQVFTLTVNPTPNMVDPTDQVLCNGSNTQVVDFTSSVNNSTYHWVNSNTSIGLGANGVNDIPSFTALNPGNIPISSQISVTPSFTNNGLTCTGIPISSAITVNPTPKVNDPINLVYCNGELTNPVNFSGNVNGTIYSWSNDLPSVGIGASGIGNIQVFTATNSSTLPQTANLIVTPIYSNLGSTCIGSQQDFTITVNPSAIPISEGNEICSNQYTDLIINTNLSSQVTWGANNNLSVTGETLTPQSTNYINDELFNNGNTAQIVNYTIYLETIDFGCTSGPFNIPVKVNPLPDVQYTAINAPFCNLDPIQFQNNTPGSNSYSWNFGDGNLSNEINAVNVFDAYGTYNVALTATDLLTGCVDSVIKPLTILASPIVGFTASSTKGCVLFDVVFTDTINAQNTSLLWEFGDGETSFQPVAIDHQFNEEGCYDISLTVTNEVGCSSTLTKEDFVCAYELPTANFIANPDSMLVTEPNFEFTNFSSNSYTYLWEFGDGNTSLSTNPIHTYPNIPGNYVVTLYAYNELGCYDSTFFTVTVYEDIIVYVPNSFTPNGDGTNDIFLPIITSGLDEKKYTMYIFNRWGDIVFESHNPNEGWDGSYPDVLEHLNGMNNYAQDGVYTWKIIFNGSQNEEALEKIGHVNLLR